MVSAHDIFELRLFDRTLLTFRFGQNEPAVLLEADRGAMHLMPLGLELDDEGLWRWLSTRAIPQNRRFATELCRSLGLSANDRSGILEVSKGLSLNDSYWIVPRGFDGVFADFNLFENGFSEVLAAIAYTGAVSDLRGLTPSTPELTTNGTLRKAWRINEQGVRRLFKGSSEGAPAVGEARAEFLASQVTQAMDVDSVGYTLEGWHGDGDAEPCSVCDCFCSADVSYVPHALAFSERSHNAAARSYLKWGEEHFEHYASMMVFDALICNTDRHLTNFGVLRDSRTGAITGCAPVFDNGRSLFFNLTFEQTDFAQEERFALPSWPQVTFEEQAARLMGSVQVAQLEKLASFEFENCTAFEFPQRYLNALGAHIRQRAEHLAQLPPVDRGALRATAGEAR